ncbi:hypothetical protein MASR2M70_10880 [Bacillota bacterium]
MNELIRIENGEVRLDSRMIADHFGKAHSDVLKDIRDEIGKLENAGLEAEGIFSLGSYLDKNGQARPNYDITEEGALQLAARYDAVARRKLIIKIKELKEQSTNRMDNLSPQLQLLISMELKQQEQPAIIQNSRTLVPLRAISEALEAEVTWDDKTRTVTIVR